MLDKFNVYFAESNTFNLGPRLKVLSAVCDMGRKISIFHSHIAQCLN